MIPLSQPWALEKDKLLFYIDDGGGSDGGISTDLILVF